MFRYRVRRGLAFFAEFGILFIDHSLFPKVSFMLHLSSRSKFFCGFFAFLTVLVLGHDVYVWRLQGTWPDGAAGSLFKYYLPDWYRELVQWVGPDVFQAFFVPVLTVPLRYLMAGGLALSFIVGEIAGRRAFAATKGMTKTAYYRSKKIEKARHFSDKVN